MRAALSGSGRVVQALLLAALLGAPGCGRGESLAPRKPRNVVLISVCSIRADHTSLYGYARDTTPNLRAFSRDAVVFDTAISQWPKTTPAFATLMSAKYGHTTGVMRITPNQVLGDENETLAEVLASHGYATAAFVSTMAVFRANILQGFAEQKELWQELLAGQWGAPSNAALAWLEQRDPKRPFFLWVHYNNAHYPLHGGGAPPETFVGDDYYNPDMTVRLHTDPRMRLALEVPADHPGRDQILMADMGGLHHKLIRWNEVPRERVAQLAYYVARYDAGVLGADLAIGRLLDGLRAQGLLDDTVVAFVGDHGESLGDQNYFFEHGRFPYDSTARVPLFIRFPNGQHARHVELPVASFALAPTLLDAVGSAPPKDWESHSLMPVIERRAAPPAYVFSESGYQRDYTLAVRDSRWKLIWVPNEIDRRLQRGVEYELYDYRADPCEQNNVADAHPEVVAELRGVLQGWAQPWLEKAHERVYQIELNYTPEQLANLAALGYVNIGDSSDSQAVAPESAAGAPPLDCAPTSAPIHP